MTYPIRREVTRVNNVDGTWCRAQLEIRLDREGRQVFAITGESGTIQTDEEVDKMGLESLKDYFAERNPDMTDEELTRHANMAASFGDTGGVETAGDNPCGEGLLVLDSCGCLHDEIREWFPEFRWLIPWHLNNMRKDENGERWLYG